MKNTEKRDSKISAPISSNTSKKLSISISLRDNNMATLPPGWVADYDGQRWFYCYTATSHTQYHFPKPGDEFPEFSLVNDHSKNDGLLPEEKLESERQVRKRAALRGHQGGTTIGKRSGEDVNDRQRQDEKENDGGKGMFSFESFGYLGPGSCSKTMMSLGPVMDGRAGKAAQRPPSLGTISKLASVGTETDTGEGTTATESEPSTRNDANLCGHIVEAFELTLPARPDQVPFPPSGSSFVYNRGIAPLTAGTIAELVSESTALCEEEINPPPVELPATGASWLESGPLPKLVNQRAVELPSVEDPLPSRHKDGGVNRFRQETNTLARTEVVDEHMSTWCTNWMSTSTDAQAPPRPSKVISQSNLPLRQDDSPQIPSKTTPEEKLHQEILDFFPAALPLPEDYQIARDAEGTSSSMQNTEKRHPSISSSDLSHFPSVLRPGPRRSSQPPSQITHEGSQNSSKSSAHTPDAETLPAFNGRSQFRAFQPLRPQNMTTTRKTDPPPPQVMGRHPPGQVLNKVLAMPDPKDFIGGTAVARFKMIEPEWKPSH